MTYLRNHKCKCNRWGRTQMPRSCPPWLRPLNPGWPTSAPCAPLIPGCPRWQPPPLPTPCPVIFPERILFPCPVTRFWLFYPQITLMASETSAVPSRFLGSHLHCFIFSLLASSAAWDERPLLALDLQELSMPLLVSSTLPSWRGDVWLCFTWIVGKASNLHPRE